MLAGGRPRRRPRRCSPTPRRATSASSAPTTRTPTGQPGCARWPSTRSSTRASSWPRSPTTDGEFSEAIRYRLRILDVDPYDEDAHLGLINSLLAQRRHGEARRAYRTTAPRWSSSTSSRPRSRPDRFPASRPVRPNARRSRSLASDGLHVIGERRAEHRPNLAGTSGPMMLPWRRTRCPLGRCRRVTEVGPIVDLRGTAVDIGRARRAGAVAVVRRVRPPLRRRVERARHRRARRGPDQGLRLDARAADQPQLARVLAALDDGRAVAFYGWWPTAELAGVSDILGVDAMDVPPPDRKGAGLADGHAVVALGYGRHAAFPGGGYLIVRNPWAGVGWGDARRRLPAVHVPAGVRHRAAHVPARRRGRRTAGGRRRAGRRPTRAGGSRACRRSLEPSRRDLAVDPIDRLIATPRALLRPALVVHRAVLLREPDRRRPGEVDLRQVHRARRCAWRGRSSAASPTACGAASSSTKAASSTHKRGRGRPRKLPLPTLVDEVTGMPVVA